jgi:hypothetical protein
MTSRMHCCNLRGVDDSFHALLQSLSRLRQSNESLVPSNLDESFHLRRIQRSITSSIRYRHCSQIFRRRNSRHLNVLAWNWWDQGQRRDVSIQYDELSAPDGFGQSDKSTTIVEWIAMILFNVTGHLCHEFAVLNRFVRSDDVTLVDFRLNSIWYCTNTSEMKR